MNKVNIIRTTEENKFFNCPNCNEPLREETDYLEDWNFKTKCPKCKNKFKLKIEEKEILKGEWEMFYYAKKIKPKK